MLALEHGEPLDEAVYCEVMFDKRTSGEVPEHRAFIYETALPRLERLGIPVRVLRSDKTYLDLFAGTVTRGPKKGLRRGFPLCGHCYVQRDCKLRPIRRYNRTLTPDTVQYVGIAYDEQKRLSRLKDQQVSLLGCFLLCMRLPTGAAAGSAPTPEKKNCDISMIITRNCGNGCWNCRPCRGRCLRNSIAQTHFQISTRVSAWRMPRNLFLKARHNEGADEKTSNLKYEITDITHEEHPFLRRIRALWDVGDQVKVGDLGGFVESESNLATDPSDGAWIFDDAIAAGNAYVDRDACLRGDAIACGSAYVSKGSVMSGHSRAEDNAYLRGASMTGKALASGNAQIIHDPHTMGTPILSGNCKVYGTVQGDIRITGSAVILPCEEVRNDTRDTFVLSGKSRSVIRGIGRETLKPLQKEVSPMKTKTPKKRGVER